MNKLSKKVLTENVYSVDMVRLRIRVRSDYIKAFFDKYAEDSNVDYWETTRFTQYRHNWTFKTIDCVFGKEVSFWVGYQFNAEQKGLKHWLVIEYNPNKNDIESGYLNSILKYFFNSLETEIVSVDLACDMPVNINSIFCDKGGKQVKKVFDYGGDNKTVYLGQGSGRIKIYNKAREMGLKGVELTRYEISLDLNKMPLKHYMADISACVGVIPIYCLDSYQFDMSLNGTDKALMYAVLNGYPIEELPRRTKEKIKKILSDSAGNTLESRGFADAFRKYFEYHMSIIY